jgi:hypothetical protein
MSKPVQSVTVAAMQWSAVSDIDETAPLDASDAACLGEIRAVLEKHNKLKKFGLTLIHSHFPIADDEVLVEKVNKTTRTLIIKPMKKSEAGSTVDTQWSLDAGHALLACRVKCYIDPPGHDGPHHV